MLRNTGNAGTMVKKTSTEGNDQAKSTQTVKQVQNMQLSVFHVSFIFISMSNLEKTELWVIQREIAWDCGIQGKVATDVQTVPL